MTARSERIRAEVGGRWAISVRAYVLVVVLFAVPRVLTAGRAAGTEPYGHALIVGLVAAGLAGAVLMAADRTVFGRRADRPVPVWWVAALGGVLGAVAGGVGVVADDGPVAIIAVHALQGAVIWPFLAFVLATHDAYRREREELLIAEMRVEAERMRETGASESLALLTTAAGWRDVEQSLRETDALLAAVGGDDDWAQAASALRQTAHDVVRPASHRLRGNGVRSPVSSRTRRIVSSAFQARPLPIVPVAAAYLFVVWSAVAAGATLGPDAILASLLAIVAMAVIYSLARRARAVVSRPWWPWASIVAIAIAAVAAAAISIALTPTTVAAGVLMACVLVLVTVAVAFIVAALRSEREFIGALRERITAREVELAAVRATRTALNAELADYLHGTVQARLAAAAYAIHEAGARGDRVALGAAVAQARLALDAVVDERGPGAPATMDELRESVDAEWAGMLRITWDLPSRDLHPSLLEAVDSVIRHALGNAVIHGAATQADIAVGAGRALTVRVSDDGLGPRGGTAGLGSQIFAAVTGGEWSLEPGGPFRGAVLRATLR